MNNQKERLTASEHKTLTLSPSTSASGVKGMGQKLKDYQLLFKFRLSLLVVFSSMMAYLIVANGNVHWIALLTLGLGGFFLTAASNALNQVLEREYDAIMKRTANRPLATGRMEVSEAVLAAGLCSLFGIVFLSLFNPLTALLGTLSMVLYAYVYTPMKRKTPLAVLVGAIPGALPMMIGAVAWSGELTEIALVLFGIQFFWQFPHFWAIAWLADEDYKKAGYQLLPSEEGLLDANVGFQSLIFAILLLIVGIAPYFIGVVGWISTVLVSVLALHYCVQAWKLYRNCDRESARKLMFSSFFYLPFMLILFWIDKV